MTRYGGEGGILNVVAEPCHSLHRIAVLMRLNPHKTFRLGAVYFALIAGDAAKLKAANSADFSSKE